MRIHRERDNHSIGFFAKSKRNHFEFHIGISKYIGVFGGVELREAYDWWNLAMGLTVMCFYFSIKFHWRVFGCGYDRKDKEDIYYA